MVGCSRVGEASVREGRGRRCGGEGVDGFGEGGMEGGGNGGLEDYVGGGIG